MFSSVRFDTAIHPELKARRDSKCASGNPGAALSRPLGELVAGRIGVISAYDAVVIVAWGYDGCADGSGTNAHGHTTAHVSSAMNAAAIDAPHVNAAPAIYGSIGQGISGKTCDAENGSRGD